jgi:AcrR family transcriptional regulator
VSTTEPPGLRERKKRETARAIEVAAVELVFESSLAEVTVEAISARADVTSRTFFNYYAGKEDAVLGNSRAFPPPTLDDLRLEPGAPVIDAVLEAVITEFESFELGRAGFEEQKRAILLENPDLLARSFRTLGDIEESIARGVVRLLGEEGSIAEVEREDHAWGVVFLIGAMLRLAMRTWTHDTGRVHPLGHHISDARTTLLAAAGR